MVYKLLSESRKWHPPAAPPRIRLPYDQDQSCFQLETLLHFVNHTKTRQKLYRKIQSYQEKLNRLTYFMLLVSFSQLEWFLLKCHKSVTEKVSQIGSYGNACLVKLWLWFLEILFSSNATTVRFLDRLWQFLDKNISGKLFSKVEPFYKSPRRI